MNNSTSQSHNLIKSLFARRLMGIVLMLMLSLFGYSTTFYSQGSSDASVPGNWNTAPGGGGTAATAADFTGGNTFIVQSAMTTGSTWTLSGVGSLLQISSGSLTVTKTVNVVNINLSGGTLIITTNDIQVNSGAWTYNSGTFTPGTSGSIIFTGTSTIGGTLNTTFYNLTISTGTLTPSVDFTITNKFKNNVGLAGFVPGTHTVTFTGATSITTQPTTFNNLIISSGSLTPSVDLTINGAFTNNASTSGFVPGTNTVTFGTGGSITGAFITTFYTLAVNTTNATDVVPIVSVANGGPGGVVIATGNTRGTLNLIKGILKVGSANTISFAKDFTITRTSGNLANSADGAGDVDADGGTIIVANGNHDNPGDIINGGPTVYNISNVNNDVLALDATAGVYMRVNGTFGISGSGSNQFVVSGNSPIWGASSTLSIDGGTQWNYSNLSVLWNAAPGSTIGTTPGFPNNVTIYNNNNNQGAISQSIPINGVLTIGDGSTTSLLSFSGGTSGAFYCSGFVENANSTVTLPSSANFTTKGKFVIRGGTFTNNSGTVTMSGSGTCSGPDSLKMASGNLYNLTVANTAYIKLYSAITVSNTLTLPTSGSSGIIETDATNILSVTNTASTAISGGGTSNFINGPLNWSWPSGLASTTYTFPLGAVTCPGTFTYLPFKIVPQTGSTMTATAQAFNSASGGSGSGVTGLSTTEYWKLSTTVALSSGSSVSLQRPSSITVGSVIAGSTGQASTSNSSYNNLSGTVGGSGPYTISTSNNIGTSSPWYFAISNPSPIVTLPATSITTTTATLNGSYNTSGASTATSFSYGTTVSSGLGAPATIHSPINSTSAKADSAFITGLTPNTLYTFKAVAGALGNGGDLTFTTLPNPPTATAGSGATTTTITANWTAPTGQGSETFTYTVQISSDPTFATGVITQANIVSSNTNYTFTGLSPATTYYYRVEAVNVTGSSTWSSTSPPISTLLATSSTCSSAANANAGILYVNKSTPAALPTIDGTIDGAWSSATAYTIPNVTVGGSTDLNNTSGGTFWKALWSTDSLYLLVQVTDAGSLVSLPSSMSGGGATVPGTATVTQMSTARNYYDVDGVELVLDPDYSHGNSYDGTNDDQLRFNLGASTLSGQSNGTATQFVGTAFNRMAAAGVTDFQFRTSTSGGSSIYVLEVAMPWSAIYGNATTPTDLQNLGFDISVNDNDNSTGGRSSQITWNSSNGNNYLSPSNFAKAALYGCQTPPTVDKPTATSITDVSAVLGATVESGGADLNGNTFTSVPTAGSAYNTVGSPVTTNAQSIGSAVGPTLPQAYSGTRTGLSPQTHYYYVGYATNSNSVTATSNVATFWTLSSPPTTQVSAFAASSASCTGVTLNWTSAVFPKNLSIATDSGYIILRRNDGTNPTTAGITNGTAVTQAGITAAQSGTTLVTTLLSNASSYADAGLGVGTYNYLIIPFTWNGTEDSTHNYLAASAPSSNVTLSTGSIGGTAASPQTICNGSSASALTVSGYTGTVTKWQYSTDNFVSTSTDIPSSNSATLTTGQIGTPSVNTYYRAVVDNGAGCTAASSIVLITVNQPSTTPSNLSATSTTLCNTGSQTTTLTQNGGTLGTSAYWQWYTDAAYTTPIGGQLTGNASLAVSPTATTTYYLRAEGATSPCTATLAAGSILITVNQPSVAPTILNSAATICNGGSATLTQTGGSLGTGAHWQWYSDATFTTAVGGALVSTDASISVSPTVTTKYYLRAEGTSGPCVTTPIAAAGSVTITVNQPTVAPGSLTATPTTLCNAAGNTVTLTQSGGTLGSGAYWQWYTDAAYTTPVGGQIFTANASLTTSITSTTTYYLRAEGGSSPCAAVISGGSVTVFVGNRPTASVTSPSTSICSPASTTISGNITVAGADAWTLTLSNGNVITGTGSGTWSKLVTPGSTTTYTISSLVDNTSGCVSIATDLTSGETVTVSTPSTAGTPTASSSTQCLVNGGVTGTTLSQTGGSLGTSAYWQWYTDATYTTPVGGQLSGSASLTVFPLVTTTYYLRAEGGTSPCATTVTSGSVTITVNTGSVAPTSLLGNGSASLTVCAGASIALTQVGGTLGTGATWKWYNSTSFIPANNIASNTNTDASATVTAPGASVSYYLRAEGGCNSPVGSTSPKVTVTVNALPTVTVSGSGTVCRGVSKALTVQINGLGNATNPPGWSYSWSDGTTTTGPVSITTGSSSTTLTVTPNTTTTYSIVSITSAKGCTATGSLGSGTVTVTQHAAAAITSLNTAICNGGNTVISGTMATASGSWTMTLSNGTVIGPTTATTWNTTVSPTTNTTYTITALSDGSGCSSTAADRAGSELVTVNARPTGALSGSATICSGGAATLTATLTGTQPWSLTYSDGATPTTINGITSSSYLFNVSPTSAKTYTIVALSDANCTSQAGDMSGSAAITVNAYRQWTGATNTDWNTASNWCGGVPDITTDAIIPTGMPRYPILSGGNGATKNITIQGSSSVTVASTGNLSIGGTITNSGTFDATAGTIQMAGSSAQTLDASAFVSKTINNLTINNASGVSLAATANDILRITGALAFGNVNNTTFTTNSNLTLVSSASNTARVADITNAGINSGNVISGTATVERYINSIAQTVVGRSGSTAFSGRAWRLLTAPIGGSQTINASWQEGYATTVTTTLQPTPPTNAGYGTEITNKVATLAGLANTGYDKAVTNNPSILYLSGGSWQTPPNTNATDVNSQQGWMLFIRGDRTVVVTTPPFNPATVTVLRCKGTLKQNTINYTPPSSGFNVIGNPYASETGLDNIFGTYPLTVGSNYTIWDPLMGGSNGVGAFTTYAYLGPNSYTSTAHLSPFVNGKLESGQAMLLNFSTTNTVAFNETDKATSSALVFRPTSADPGTLAVSLLTPESDGTLSLDDGALEIFDTQYSDSVNWLEDAQKIANPGENIEFVRYGKAMAIEKRPPITLTDTLFIGITQMKKQVYKFQFVPQGIYQQNIIARLEDAYLNTTSPVSLADTTVFTFVVDANAASQGKTRFRIVFDTPDGGPLPVTFTNVKAMQQSTDIAVQWNVQNEQNIKEYVVEKSTDGIHFTTVATTNAVGNNSNASYNWVDKNASTGDNYYRIRSTGSNGAVQYSQVVDVKMGGASMIAVYPNPIRSGSIGLQFTNMPKGKYGLRLIDNIGQIILVKEITHDGSSATQSVPFTGLAKGVYHLSITGPDNYTNDLKVIY